MSEVGVWIELISLIVQYIWSSLYKDGPTRRFNLFFFAELLYFVAVGTYHEFELLGIFIPDFVAFFEQAVFLLKARIRLF